MSDRRTDGSEEDSPAVPTEAPEQSSAGASVGGDTGRRQFLGIIGGSAVFGTGLVIATDISRGASPERLGDEVSRDTSETAPGQRAKLVAPDGDSDDRFGTSVAVSGDGATVLVGAADDEDPNGPRAGAAYVFEREGGSWTQGAKLAATDGDPGDHFGTSVEVSSDGTTALIGAPSDEDPNGGQAGAAYVFERDGGAWTQGTKLAATDGDGMRSSGGTGDLFGASVAMAGDGTTALIGARYNEDPNGKRAGAAYVFEQRGGGWSQQAKLVAPDGDSDDRFGTSVAVSGDGATALIGATGDEDPNSKEAGAAYVFERSGEGWTGGTKLAAADGDSGDWFGSSVTVSNDGTTALVGASSDEDPNGYWAGAAYVFERDGGAWPQEAKLDPDGGDSYDHFGRSISMSSDGETVLVGAPGDEDPNGPKAGTVYGFEPSGGGWSQQAQLAPDGGDSYDYFGRSISMSSDGATVLVGTPDDEDPNGQGAGVAYVFDTGVEATGTTATATSTNRTTTGGTTIESSGGSPETTGGSGGGSTPGFGIVSLLTGLTATGYLLRRRNDDE